MTKTPHPEGWPQEALSRFSDTVPEGMCQLCGDPVKAQGRRKKRFCRDLCRTRFHYARRLGREAELTRRLSEAGVAIAAARGLARTSCDPPPTPQANRSCSRSTIDG